MAHRTRAALKAFFETGDVPTQSNFGDFVENSTNSLINVAAVAGLTAGADVAAAINTQIPIAQANGQGLLIDLPGLVWSSNVVLPANVPLVGRGPNGGFIGIDVTLTNGTVACATANADGAYIDGIKLHGSTDTVGQNFIGFRFGEVADYWEAGAQVFAGRNYINGVNLYTADATGTASATPPTHTSGSANGFTFVSAYTAWAPTRNVSLAHARVWVEYAAVGFQGQGWLNQYNITARYCDLGAHLTAQNATTLRLHTAGCNQPYTIVDCAGLNFDGHEIESGVNALSRPATIDGCLSMTCDGGYLEAGTTISPRQTQPFIRVGFRKECVGITLDKFIAIGLDHPNPYLALDKVKGIRGDWSLFSAGGLRSNNFFTKTDATADYGDLTYESVNTASSIAVNVNDVAMPRNWAPVPDCSRLAGWDLINGIRATVTLDTTQVDHSRDCYRIASQDAQTSSCYGLFRLTHPKIIGALKGQLVTFLVRMKPLAGTAGTKTSQANFTTIATGTAGGAVNIGPAAGNVISGVWNDVVFTRRLPSDLTQLELQIQSRVTTGSTLADIVLVDQILIAEGNCPGTLKQGRWVDANPFVRVIGGLLHWETDTIPTTGTSVFVPGDVQYYLTAQSDGAITRTCTVGGVATSAVFAKDPKYLGVLTTATLPTTGIPAGSFAHVSDAAAGSRVQYWTGSVWQA